jgi:hypothetical protein
MKKLAMVLALVALGWGTVSAQNNGNGCGNGNGNGNGGNGNGYGNGNNSSTTSQSAVLPNALVVRILHDAQPFFNAQTGINLGQLIQAYRNGTCTIVLVATNPPTNNVFRVRMGGLDTIIIIDEL